MKVLILIHPNFYSCKEFENNLVLKVVYEVCVVSLYFLNVENVNKSSTEYGTLILFTKMQPDCLSSYHVTGPLIGFRNKILSKSTDIYLKFY